MTRSDVREKYFRRAFWWLLRFYPASFRVDYGADMADTFVDQLRIALASGTQTTFAFFAGAAMDAVANGTRERINVLTSRARMFHWMDVRYAFRLLRKSPVFSLLTMSVLAGGLAVSIFTFSFLNTAMVKPLPLKDGDRIVRILQSTGDNSGGIDAADLAFMRPSIKSLTSMGAFYGQELVVGDNDSRTMLSATISEWNIFEMSGTRPLLGRGFRADDQQRGAEPMLVLSERTWRSKFGSDSALVGSHIQVNGKATRVIGVMPAGYGFPVASEGWMPIGAELIDATMPGGERLDVYARLANGANMNEAHTELSALLARALERDRQLVPNTPSQNSAAQGAAALERPSIDVQTFPMAQIGEDGPLFLTIMNVLATLILLLACVNVMNLLLARANERARETAVRLALGATRARLIVQSMWESALLCLAGGVLAVAIAAWGLDFINSWAQQNLSGNLAFWWVWKLDRSSIIAGIIFTASTIGVLGMAVSVRASSAQFASVINDGGARSGGRRQGRMARILVATQVATVSILMFFGVLSGIVAARVATVDMGYDTHNLLSANVALGDSRKSNVEQQTLFADRLVSELAVSPAVQSALVRANLADITDASAQFEPRESQSASIAKPRAFVQAMQGSFATLGVSTRAGRMFDSRDAATAARTAIVSASLAAKTWPGVSPVGHQLRLTGLNAQAEWITVVGVVSDVLYGNPMSRDRSALAIYVPLAQNPSRVVNIIARHRGDAVAGQVAINRTLAVIDPTIAPPTISSFDEVIEKTTLIARSTAKLFGLCFGFALLLAVSGTYGLMARSIGQRSREIGVRRALGASDGNVTRLLLSQGTRQMGIGVVVALPVLVAIGFGFSRFFPIGAWVAALSGVLVVASIVGVVIVATYVPTRRVIVMPLREALRNE